MPGVAQLPTPPAGCRDGNGVSGRAKLVVRASFCNRLHSVNLRTFRAGRSGQSVPEHIGVAGLSPQGQQNATRGLTLRRLSAGQRMRAKSTTPTAPDDPPSSRRREASLLPSKPQRPSHLANFLIFLVENLLSASFFPRALGSVLSALAPTCVQCAEGQHAKSVENRFARHEKFDYLTLLELLKVAPSCRCARRSRHPRGMPLRGGTE